jgi:hypothetical protein
MHPLYNQREIRVETDCLKTVLVILSTIDVKELHKVELMFTINS